MADNETLQILDSLDVELLLIEKSRLKSYMNKTHSAVSKIMQSLLEEKTPLSKSKESFYENRLKAISIKTSRWYDRILFIDEALVYDERIKILRN